MATTLNSLESYSHECLDKYKVKMDLNNWQQMGWNEFGSQEGFDATVMRRYLQLLSQFLLNDKLDDNIYRRLFGASLQDGEGEFFWPSIYFRELTDDFIVGCGERQLADSLEMLITRKLGS
jgi:hypothetical protein